MLFSKLLTSVVVLSGCVYSYNPVFFNTPKIWNNVSKNPIHSGSSIIHINEWKNALERKECGESLKHTAGLVVDKTDKESIIFVEGSIRTNKLIFKLGCIKEKEIYIKNILLPIETISSKCINIRQKIQEESTILCLENKFLRNFWINSITDAVLCHETKVKGKLPQYKYSEDEKKQEENLNNEIKKEETKEIPEEEIKEIPEEEIKEIPEEEIKEIPEEEIKEIPEEEIKEIPEEEIKEIPEEEIKEIPEEEIKEENKNESIENANDENQKESTEIMNNENVYKQNEEWKKNILKEEFEDDIEKDEEQKGLKLRIGKSKYGYPKVKINGTDIQEIQKNYKSGELRSTNIEDTENLTNIENNISEEIEESTTE